MTPREAAAIPGPELAQLAKSVQQAFGLATSGASSRGYRLLCQGRERARQLPAFAAAWRPELLRRWDAALHWFEHHAPPPL